MKDIRPEIHDLNGHFKGRIIVYDYLMLNYNVGHCVFHETN